MGINRVGREENTDKSMRSGIRFRFVISPRKIGYYTDTGFHFYEFYSKIGDSKLCLPLFLKIIYIISGVG